MISCLKTSMKAFKHHLYLYKLMNIDIDITIINYEVSYSQRVLENTTIFYTPYLSME